MRRVNALACLFHRVPTSSLPFSHPPPAGCARTMAPKKDAKGGKNDPKAQSKAAKASSGGGKQKKKKWSKGKNKEKVCGCR